MNGKHNFDDAHTLHAYISQEEEDLSGKICTLDGEIRAVAARVYVDDRVVEHLAQEASGNGIGGLLPDKIVDILAKNPEYFGRLKISMLPTQAQREEIAQKASRLSVLMQGRVQYHNALNKYRYAHQRLFNLNKIRDEYQEEELEQINLLRIEADSSRDVANKDQSDRWQQWGRETAPVEPAIPTSSVREGQPSLPESQSDHIRKEEDTWLQWLRKRATEREVEQSKMLEQEGQIPDRDDTRGRR